MATAVDYLKWRGDLRFSQDPLNPVDALIFSVFSYIYFEGCVAEEPTLLKDAAQKLLAMEDCEDRAFSPKDVALLRTAMETERFSNIKICGYRSLFVPHQDTQFAAVSFLLDDESMAISFRGTDDTLVGWKEDFNMCFQQTIPAQRLAVQYVRDLYAQFSLPMHICGHSKGGNMAVFAAARSSPLIQKKILGVYNNDGPGFSDYLMGDPGYLAMVPRIHTFVPQSSLIGMILDHEEEYEIVKSSQVGILQHDAHTWEVLGNHLVPMEHLSAHSRFFNRTLKNWLAGMTNEERNQMVDVLFELLSTGNVGAASDIFHLKNIRNYVKAIAGSNNSTRKVLTEEFVGLLEAAKQAYNDLEEESPQ